MLTIEFDSLVVTFVLTTAAAISYLLLICIAFSRATKSTNNNSSKVGPTNDMPFRITFSPDRIPSPEFRNNQDRHMVRVNMERFFFNGPSEVMAFRETKSSVHCVGNPVRNESLERSASLTIGPTFNETSTVVERSASLTIGPETGDNILATVSRQSSVLNLESTEALDVGGEFMVTEGIRRNLEASRDLVVQGRASPQ